MKVAPNFIIQEFVPKSIYDIWGDRSTYFINPKIPALAQFYKEFFLDYYKKKHGADKVKDVLIIINNWHSNGSYQYRGFRPRSYSEGGENSQHRLGNAFDCDIIILFNDGSRMEADYKEIHSVIMANQALFIASGLTTVEDVKYAPTWLHSDCRWIPNQTGILTVKPL